MFIQLEGIRLNISSKLKDNASKYGDKPAYYFQDTPTSYTEFDAAVSKFAHSLTEMGLKPGDHIALLLGNSPHYVISLYGSIRAGVKVIPVNPTYTPDEISYILNDGDVKAVVTIDLLLPLFEKVSPLLQKLEQIIYCETPKDEKGDFTSLSIYSKMKSFTELISSGNHLFEGPHLDQEDVAIILYTSGTTGKPKGAMLTHKNIFSNAQDTANYLNISDHDRVIATLPMFHVFCLTVALNAPIMNGGTVIIVPRFSPGEIFEIVKKHEATVFAGVPTMYNFLLQFPNANEEDLKSLKLCISGGASMPVALLKSFEKKFQVAVSEGYGLSEASPVTCFNPLNRPRKPGSIGTSIINVENKVVDELGNEVPVGEVGELVVRGPNVMRGYYKMPEESVHTIRDGWLFTGDLARMDDEGYFYIVDRKKDMIIVGGFNVYPREVEEVLYSHPSVLEVAVVGVPDQNFGETVRSFVVTKPDQTVTEEELISFCAEHLAKYKIPSMIEFLEELPKNTTGKILRRALKDKLLNA